MLTCCHWYSHWLVMIMLYNGVYSTGVLGKIEGVSGNVIIRMTHHRGNNLDFQVKSIHANY